MWFTQLNSLYWKSGEAHWRWKWKIKDRSLRQRNKDTSPSNKVRQSVSMRWEVKLQAGRSKNESHSQIDISLLVMSRWLHSLCSRFRHIFLNLWPKHFKSWDVFHSAHVVIYNLNWIIKTNVFVSGPSPPILSVCQSESHHHIYLIWHSVSYFSGATSFS